MKIVDKIQTKLKVKCIEFYLNILNPFFKKYNMSKPDDICRDWLNNKIIWAWKDESHKNIIV